MNKTPSYAIARKLHTEDFWSQRCEVYAPRVLIKQMNSFLNSRYTLRGTFELAALFLLLLFCRAAMKNTSHENKVLPQLLRISYKDPVINEEVRAKIQQAVGPHEHLTIFTRRELQWYGHFSRSACLSKTILQGTEIGGRRQGRQKRWEDNIRECTGLEFAKSHGAVESREKVEETNCEVICGSPTSLEVKE